MPKVVTPVEDNIPLSSCKPFPICNVCTGEVPAPNKIPVSVDEPVPPLIGKVTAACVKVGKRSKEPKSILYKSFILNM